MMMATETQNSKQTVAEGRTERNYLHAVLAPA
jgi:hypothetical protein